MDDNSNNTLEPGKVGYCNPPKHTQFKKGQSGNPKGRPPMKPIHDVLLQVLNEHISVTTNGEKIKMSKKEAVIQQLINQCISGKSAATRNFLLLLRNLPNIMPM